MAAKNVNKIKDNLLRRIKSRESVVAVVGLGYVGLPFVVEKAKVGFKVIGYDRSASRVKQVNEGVSYIDDVPTATLKSLVAKGLIEATTDPRRLAEADVIVICVPTPLTKDLKPDLQFIVAVTKDIAKILRPGQLVSLESTTYPGTTEEIMMPILNKSGLRPGKDYFLAHSPERVDPGNKRYTTKNTNKVVGGVDPDSTEVAATLYGQTILHVEVVSNARAAEMVKIFENTYRAVNIALVNELATLCHKMNLNVWEVLDAAFTKPFGIQAFYPGPGVGGHCIPIDPHYLEWKAREYGFETKFIALAGATNRGMPRYVVERMAEILKRNKKKLKGANVVALGVTYKKDLADERESPAMDVIEHLIHKGAKVTYVDSYIPETVIAGKKMSAAKLTPKLLSGADIVVILTDHSDVDYGKVARASRAVLDTRGVTRKLKIDRSKVDLL